MQKLTEKNITETVLNRLCENGSPRLKEVVASLVRHAHECAREVSLTPEEWLAGIKFLTAIGRICDDKRQEFILLSDTLGVSALVDLIDNRAAPTKATESSLLGPFFREGAPELPNGADISNGTAGERIFVHGRVTSIDARPIPGARLDVWQAAPNGKYDLQDEHQPEMNLRGRFRTDAEGRFKFRSIKPASYPVPTDGPVGTMLQALGSHPYRPAHVHFMISAPRYRTLTTALYMNGDKYLDSDAVFGSRESLAVDYRPYDGSGAEEIRKMDSVEFNFVLNPQVP
ncbi:MAG TPA: intradiol ring-cleavage dioxygenase [Candidatus Binataceae bacterium]